MLLRNAIKIFNFDLREYIEKLWDKSIPIVRHAVIEAVGLKKEKLDDKELIINIEIFCKKMNFHIVKQFNHQFEPQGSSVVFILEESHISVHTWPEIGYLHMDIVTCTKEDLEALLLINEFISIFKPTSTRVIKFRY